MKKQLVFKSVLLVLLLVMTGQFISAQSFTKQFKNEPLTGVIKELERQTGYSFIYETGIFRDAPAVTADFNSASVQTVLRQILKPPFKYEMKGKIITISKTESKASSATTSDDRQTEVSGTVKDAKTGEPLVGVAVWVKDTPIGVSTDLDGHYKLSFKGNYGYISISCIGYVPQEVQIKKGAQVINVSLEQDGNTLEEAVAVGYGHQKKASIVGAIATIAPDAVKIPVSKISNALAGRLSGVVSVQRSGEPGAGSTFWIRGISTFGANANPLVLIDGVERELDLVDVEDIKEFSVLKDAAATAVYGVRGANGVVLITTRSGEEGKPKVTIKFENGVTSPVKVPKMANAAQYMEMYNVASGTEYFDADRVRKTMNGEDPDLYPNVDWVNSIFKGLSNNTRANVNVSGGTSSVKYYISGGFYNENGLFKTDPTADYNTGIYYRRFNFRANVDVKLTRHTSMNVNLATTFEQKNESGTSSSSIWSAALKTPSVIFPMVYSDGHYPGPGKNMGYNPYALLTQTGYKQAFYNTAQSLVSLTHDFSWLTDGLTATVKGSFDAKNNAYQNRTRTPEQYGQAYRDENGELHLTELVQGSQTLDFSYSNSGWRSLYLEASLNYARSFGNHSISGLLLYQQSQKNYIGSSATSSNAALPYRHQGVAFRATYNYDSRYFVEFNAGYNGSENFSPGHRFGFFPSVAGGWLVSNEKFWTGRLADVISMLKIKGSYGIVGNDQIGGNRRFIYLETINSGSSWNFGETVKSYPSYRRGEWANDNVGWEKSRKLDVGIDVTFFDKLRVQVDWFKEKRSGIFLQRSSIPEYVGITTKPYVNIGRMRNSGWDCSLQYDQKIGQVTFSAMGNFTFARNVIEDQDQPDYIEKYMNRTGQARWQTFGYVSDGLFKDEADIATSPDQSALGEVRPGDIRYKDLNNDGVIDSKDVKAIGYTDVPEIVYGFGVSAQWKGFDVSVFFQGNDHVSFSINSSMVRGFTEPKMAANNVFSDIYGNYWTESNTDAKYPRLTTTEATNNNQSSDFWLVNGRYLRLKNAEFGYTFPKKLIQKIRLSQLRIFVSGTNLLTFAPFKLWDPDLQTGASNYPNTRVANIGLNIGF